MALLIGSSALAVIIESRKIQEITPYIDAQTLVVFDIDNTLIQPNQSLGSDQWFRYVLRSYVDKGISQEAALDKTLGFWKQINKVSNVSPVEYGEPLFVRKLQQSGITTMVLTARGTDVVAITDRQLNQVKLDFTKSSPFGDNDLLIDKGIRYRRGVLYVSGQDKGTSLIKFLQHFRLSPKKVLFIDDLSKNVHSVEAALTKAQIDVLNVRYGALDEKVKSFNPKLTLVEWGIFSKYQVLITDDEALKIINRKP